jgi:hypothetical protein
MACGDAVEREVTTWRWCRKFLVVPWRCKKTTVKTMYQYDFLPTRTRLTWPFMKKYEGCCGDGLYEWTTTGLFGTGNGAWNHVTTVTKYFSSPRSPKGDCPFGGAGPVLGRSATARR